MADPTQAAAFVRDACGGEFETADALLARQPEIPKNDFVSACVAGDLASAIAFLKESPELAKISLPPDNRAAIVYACHSRYLRTDATRASAIVEIVRLLIEGGADPNSNYIIGEGNSRFVQTPLFGAAGIANNASLTRMLLQAGADVNEMAADTELGTEALYHASEFADIACLKLLLDARPHPSRVSYCLGRNLDFDFPEGAMAYLEHGADPNYRVAWMANRTHLQKAIMLGRDERVIAEMIARGGDVNALDTSGISAYQYAVRFGHPKLADLLARHGADVSKATDEDRLLCACVTGNGNRSGQTHSQAAFDVLCRAAQKNDVAAINRLLDAGVDVNSTGGQDHTPALHWACWRGQLAAAQLLVKRGASLTAKNQYGGDALGTTKHGSLNCQDPEGGPTMKLPSEIHHSDYPGLIQFLTDASG